MEPHAGVGSGSKDLHFRNRFRGAKKGLPRPTILSMDWYKHGGARGEEYDELMAFSTGDWIRTFGLKGTVWKMLVNRKPTGIRKVNLLKWSPEKCSRLAVASTNGHHVTVDLLDLKGGSFKKVKRFEVPQASSASCLSWNFNGKYLLVSMTRNAQHPDARMVVFKILGNGRYSVKAIFPKYDSHFTAVFHPASKIILSTSVKSSNIDVWREDVHSHEWNRLCQISCVQGITEMCFAATIGGSYIAAIVCKRLMIWKYCDKDNQAGKCLPTLEVIDYVNDDGVRRRKGVSLLKHCDNILSLDWSSAGQLITGSTMGTMCVHELHREDGHIDRKFEVLYYRWSHVHAHNTGGPVNCVSWIPKSSSKLALAGNDGVVTVWELMDLEFKNLHDRNYLKEINYFHPGHISFVGRGVSKGVQAYDVHSIDSIISTQSDAGSEVDGVSSAGDVDVSTPVSSRFRKVLEKQEDMKTVLSDLADNVEDITGRLSALAIIADEDNQNISDLTDFRKDAIEKLEGIKESMEQFSEKLQTIETEIKAYRTELDSAVKQVNEKPVDNAGMAQKVDMLLSKVDVIDKQLKSFMSEYHKLDKSLVQNKNNLEQILLARLREIEDCICAKHNDVMETLTSLTSRLRQMEDSVRAKQNNLVETLSARVGQTEARLIAIEKENQERHIEVMLKLDVMMQLLQKPGNTS